MRPRYIYQLQNLDYKEGEFGSALRNYAFITNLYGSSGIKSSADYVAGQVHFKQGNIAAAKQVLSQIPAGDENHGYGQFSLAMISLQERNTAAAIEYLNGVLAIQPESNSERVLVEAAATKLGHIYFEKVELTKAVELYNTVPVTSKYAGEALLASAWCYIKANRPEAYKMAVNKVDRLISNHPKSTLVPEAYLAKGYCFSQFGEFAAAKENFQKCIDVCRKPLMSEDQVKQRESGFQSSIQGFSGTEQTIMANALRKPNEKVLSARAELEPKFMEFRDVQKQRMLFEEGLGEMRLFRRSKDQILKDAEFALATVDNLAASKTKEKIMEDFEEDQQKIDREIEQLQKELEMMDQ